MYFRQLLNDQSACASYLLGCKTNSKFAVVDPPGVVGAGSSDSSDAQAKRGGGAALASSAKQACARPSA